MRSVMKGIPIYLFVLCCVSVLALPDGAFAEGTQPDLERRIEQLEKRIGEYEKGEKEALPGAWAEKITLNGAVEFDYTYQDDSNLADSSVNDSTSDLYIGTVELGLGIAFHEAVTGSVVLKAENVGDDPENDDTDDDPFVDEAIITIQQEGFPLYFVGGKRTQPFGFFNNHLISDPITQDCYEVVKAGATVGYTPGILNMDMSLTAYRGETLADKVAETGWLDWSNTADTDDISSYIANVTAYCLNECMVFSLYYDSEPGEGSRNETIGGTFSYAMENIGLTLDAEYIAAVDRENAAGGAEESAWFAGAAYRVIDPMEIAVRYESFDDDQNGDQDLHLENRYSLGVTYTLFEKDPFVCNLMGEYRKSNYEAAAGGSADDDLDEFFARVAIAF
jgi:hypothetical protein